jgi:hypothetical protein
MSQATAIAAVKPGKEDCTNQTLTNRAQCTPSLSDLMGTIIAILAWANWKIEECIAGEQHQWKHSQYAFDQVRDATHNLSCVSVEILAATTQQSMSVFEQSVKQTISSIDQIKELIESIAQNG